MRLQRVLPHEQICLRNSGYPVLHAQARHQGKVAGVVGDQRCQVAEGVGGDHGVEQANRGAAALKVSPEIAIGPEGRIFTRKDSHGGEKHLQRMAVAGPEHRSWPRSPLNPAGHRLTGRHQGRHPFEDKAIMDSARLV